MQLSHVAAPNGPIAIQNSASEPGKQQGSQRNSADISPINGISPLCFHLNREGNRNSNDNSSSEEHLENSKTSRVSYLYIELYIFSRYLNSLVPRNPVPLNIHREY